MKALFLDRDGVLNVLRHNDYVKCPDEMVVLPGVPAEYFQALCLQPPLAQGEVQYSPAFEATA